MLRPVALEEGRAERIPEQDMIDAKYALAAFADEVIFHSTWPGKTQWLSNPLQLQFFQTNTAGDGFFSKLLIGLPCVSAA